MTIHEVILAMGNDIYMVEILLCEEERHSNN